MSEGWSYRPTRHKWVLSEKRKGRTHADLFWGDSMRQESSKTRFWAILTMINIVAMTYPVMLYFQADNSDTQFFAAIVLVGSAFLLAITDAVSAILVYLE